MYKLEAKMLSKNFGLGILVMVLVFGMTAVGCDNGSTSNNEIAPEEKSPAERWDAYTEDSAKVTLDISVNNDVCSITVGGTPEPHNAENGWNRWKASAGYSYTAKANKNYTYVFEAWTEAGNRIVNVQYYYDSAGTTLYTGLDITPERTTYEIPGQTIPKNGVQKLEFQCADILGTFYIKILSIEVDTSSTNNEPKDVLDGTTWVASTVINNFVLEFKSPNFTLTATGSNPGTVKGTYTVSNNNVTITGNGYSRTGILSGTMLTMPDDWGDPLYFVKQ
jgi:hypothetical protein